MAQAKNFIAPQDGTTCLAGAQTAIPIPSSNCFMRIMLIERTTAGAGYPAVTFHSRDGATTFQYQVGTIAGYTPSADEELVTLNFDYENSDTDGAIGAIYATVAASAATVYRIQFAGSVGLT